MLDLDVQPARSLGNEYWEFILGMPLYQAIALIKSQDDLLKNIQLMYNQHNALANDIVLDLAQDCIRLHFDSYLQRLKVIEVYDMSKIKLKYLNEYFNSPSTLPTITQIDNCFGATHPAKYNADKTIFSLNFRGLTFIFKILDGSSYETSPVVTSLFIYSGQSLTDAIVPSIPSSCFYAGLYLEKFDGDRLMQAADEASPYSSIHYATILQEINFGDTTQDVISKIGSPSRMHYKDYDKMKIHCPKKHNMCYNTSDYFFNYLNYGVDILFDARTHVVKKLVMHTNFPNHFNFNIYYRCHFQIPLSVSRNLSSFDSDELVLNNNFITFDTKWSSVMKYLITPHTKPVVRNRMYDNQLFREIHCFGCNEFIFEVMSCDQIASVTVYQPSKDNK
ncbi:hypothetical protein HELRODRAFT_187040 [Helobdella robusta]|uniref:Uncharacterized protein n=1 Tax=Helobdella robusta TaxID=6412 RepID=T1FP59_HELRO|nr:hypothetical protein HELRODRAFT_187040 [Helobdella robusta]ESO04072.1 hypothetical protein HELRODRAFT_187040 [Helobdella robusta]